MLMGLLGKEEKVPSNWLTKKSDSLKLTGSKPELFTLVPKDKK